MSSPCISPVSTCSHKGLISCQQAEITTSHLIFNCSMESRYLLILTDSLSILNIILEQFQRESLDPEVVFGSRFKDDLSYTQVTVA